MSDGQRDADRWFEGKEDIVGRRVTFELVHPEVAGGAMGIRCLTCRRTSFNPYDVAHRYCGNCHVFHESLAAAREDQQ